ncbi:MAG: transglycosylase SLT domain-containing protein [Pseudomonadota bacterium]
MAMRLLVLFVLMPLALAGCQTAQTGLTNGFLPETANKGPIPNAAHSHPIGEIPPANDAALFASLRPAPVSTAAAIAVNEAATKPVKEIEPAKPTHTVVNEAATAPVKEIHENKAKAESRAKPKKKAKKRRNKRITVKEGRRRYRALIAKHAKANNVPLNLAMAVVEVESSYRRGATGAAGEIGLMQLMPRTARFIGYKGSMKALYDPDTNLRWGMKYLGKARRLGKGSLCGTILKYNAGHGAKRMNPISARYCKRIRRIMART